MIRRSGLLATMAALALVGTLSAAAEDTASVDEVHYSFTGPTSVSFDWRGAPTEIRYGETEDYDRTANGATPDPLPFSSPGPFREAHLPGLRPGTTYHYSIGGGPDATFTTIPVGEHRFDVLADVGSSLDHEAVAPIQSQVAGGDPDFVLVPAT